MRANEFINETTTAGGIATVVGGVGSAITRNASIYGNEKKPKKKKKYANGVNEGYGDPQPPVKINTPKIEYTIEYDSRFGIRSWFLTAFYKSGTQDFYIYTKDNEFTRDIPIEQVSFSDYKPFNTVDDAKRALYASSFYNSKD